MLPRPAPMALLPARLAPLLLLACAGGDGAPSAEDRARFVAALADGRCGAVEAPALRDDCWLAVAARTGDDVCGEVGDAELRGECWFQLAERRRDAALCPKAAPYAVDCALHVLSSGFAELTRGGVRPGEKEDDVAARIAASGLAADDMRPWSAWYRWVLGGMRPLDRSACDAVADPDRREACRRTGLALYDDLLNHARDTGTFPCDGGPLPAALQHAPDPELDARRAARADAATGDLCRR